MIVSKSGSTGTTYGLDVSHYQMANGLKLPPLRAQGYDFVVIKCTQGVSWSDATYAKALADAKASGWLVAAYHFLEHGNAAAQADNLSRHIIDRDVPVAIDCEPTTGSRPNLTDLVQFRAECLKRGLRVTIKYFPEWYWSQVGRPDITGPLALWASGYPSSRHAYGSELYPGPSDSHWHAYGGQTPLLWQFASTGKVDGYNGNLDVNAFRGTRAELAATGMFKDYAPVVPPPHKPPHKPPVTTHTHLQLNVQRTMSAADVTADLERAFDFGADSLVLNEMETAWHHSECARVAAAKGYSLFMPKKKWPGAVVVAVKSSKYEIVYTNSLWCVGGVAGISPSRYYNRVRVKRRDTGEYLSIGGTHMWSSGWTGSTDNDVLRKARWNAHMLIMYPAFRRTTSFNRVSIASGDINRPPANFPKGKVLGRMLDPKGMTSVGYAHTDATHGRTTFDYVWWASKHTDVTVKSWSTPTFHSDHDGVLVTLSWPTKGV